MCVNILLSKWKFVWKVTFYYFAQKEQFYHIEVMRIFRLVTSSQETLRVRRPLSPLMTVMPRQRLQTYEYTADSPLRLRNLQKLPNTTFYANTETDFGLNLSILKA